MVPGATAPSAASTAGPSPGTVSPIERFPVSRVSSPAPSLPSAAPATAPSSRTAGRWAAALTTLLLTLLLGLLGAVPASAHDTLEGSDPADGATVATVPASVTLTFNEEVQNFSPVIQVTGPDGANWADGDPTVAGVDVSVPIKAGAPAGAYTVAYRIVSSDGHPVTGELAFTAEAAAAGAAPASSAAPTSSPASSAVTSSAVTSSAVTSSAPTSPSSSSAPSSSAAAGQTTSAAASSAPSSALVSPAANSSDSGTGVSGWLIAVIVLVIAAGGAVVAVLVRRARGGSPAA